MKKHIAEDLPVRNHPQAQLSNSQASEKNNRSSNNSGGGKTPEERVSQAASDIRYRARREDIPLRQAYSQYMQNSSMSELEKTQVRNKLFGNGGIQAENFEMDIKRSAADSMAKALYRVFVENKTEVVDINQLKNGLEESVNETASSKKYKVRVTDKKSNVTYVRYATREKISELRAKGLEVEMSEYGTPYEGERTRGEKTAEVLGGGKKNDGNLANNYPPYDKVTRGDVVAGRRGEDQMGAKKKVSENFLGEISKLANLPQSDTSDYVDPKTNSDQIDILPSKVKNKIVVNPTSTVLAHTEIVGDVIVETGYSKFLDILQEKKMSKIAKKKEKKLKAKYDPSEMKANMIDQYGEDKGKKVYFASIRKQAMKEESACDSSELPRDTRGDYSKKEVIKNKIRSGLGIKNPIIITSDESDMKEGMGLSTGISKVVGNLMSNPRTPAKEAAKNFQKNVADPVGKAVKGAVKAVLSPANNSPEAQKARGDKYRPEEVELNGEVIDEEMPRTVKGPRSPGIKKPKPKKPAPPKNNDDDYDDYDYYNHPSLSASERNPGLR